MIKRVRFLKRKRIKIPPRWAYSCIDMLRRLSNRWAVLLPPRSMLDADDLYQEACLTAERITPKWRRARQRSYTSFVWFVANRDLMTLVQAEWKKSAVEFVELESCYSMESSECPLDRHVMVQEALTEMEKISEPFVKFVRLSSEGLPKEILDMAEVSRRIRAGTRIKRARLIFARHMFEDHYSIDLEVFQAILDEHV